MPLLNHRADLRHHLDIIPVLRHAGAGPTVATGLCLLVVTAVPVSASVVTGELVQSVVDVGRDGGSGRAWAMLGVFVLVTLAGWIAGALLGPLTTLLARRTDGSVRDQLFRLVGRPSAFAHLETADVADDLSRVVNNTEGRGRSFGRGAVAQLQNVSKVLGALGLGLVIADVSPLLAAVLFVGVLWVRRRVMRELEATLTSMDEYAGTLRRGNYLYDLVCTAPAAKEIRVFGLGPWVVGRHTRELQGYHQALFAVRRRLARGEFRLIPIVFVLAVTAFLWPGLAALNGDIGADALTTAVMAAMSMFTVVQAGQEQMYIAPARLALQALSRIEDTVGRSEPEESGAHLTPGRTPAIRFSGVRFAYGDQEPVLDGLDLDIHPGEVLAIVGDNGAGKTTLTKLLAGLHRPQSGRVTADGTDVTTLDPERWCECLAVVFQDFLRLHLSARANIALAAPQHADDALIRAAVDDAGAGTLLDSLPNGEDTPLSRTRADGVDLSGGQWQKIAIARALFAVRAGARVLVLDEPTAHLDIRAELDFFTQVIARVTGITVVLISHRLSTVRQADRIVLLRDGRIVESGSHDELIALDGSYAEMFALQAARFVESGAGGQAL
ncbi:ABC transporter ATP-binding protein [Streptomyces sp. NPDC127117]|uniref:ABC transporter ATP-binding protein n=1 Tax=Streptomyces sp. NPDC127117 TaxID=3345368 RepID=UPI00363B25AC